MKPYRRHRLGPKRKKMATKAAKHLPPDMQHVAFSLASNSHKRGSLGRLGAAGKGKSLSEQEIDSLRAAYETDGGES